MLIHDELCKSYNPLNRMLIVERNVKKMPLMFSSPFLHSELFPWYNSLLTIFFTTVHMLYLLLSKNRPLL